MTPDETHKTIEAMATAFPPIRDYLAKVDNWPATKAVWCKMLSAVRYDDAAAAVDRMIAGHADAPSAPWEIGNLPAWIRAVAGRVAQERARLEAADRTQELAASRQNRPGRDNLGSVYCYWIAANNLYREGAIDNDQLQECWRDVVRFNASPTEKIHIPEFLAQEYREVKAGKGREVFSHP